MATAAGDLEHGGADGSPLPGPLRLYLVLGQEIAAALVELDFEVGCAGLCEMFGGGELALVRVLERSGAKGRGAVSGVGPCQAFRMSGVSGCGADFRHAARS